MKFSLREIFEKKSLVQVFFSEKHFCEFALAFVAFSITAHSPRRTHLNLYFLSIFYGNGYKEFQVILKCRQTFSIVFGSFNTSSRLMSTVKVLSRLIGRRRKLE